MASHLPSVPFASLGEMLSPNTLCGSTKNFGGKNYREENSKTEQTYKEALAISNEKCNGLIGKQNMLIADLTTSVNEIKSDNSFYMKRQSENVQNAVKEIREITQDERKFKAEVSQSIKSEIGRTVADAKVHALEQVDETLSEIKEQLKTTANEIEREREDMKLVHGFRKFMFWATPVLLLVQTITLIFLLLN